MEMVTTWSGTWRSAPVADLKQAPLWLVDACRKPWWHTEEDFGVYSAWTPAALADAHVRAALLDGLEMHPVAPLRVEISRPRDEGWWEVTPVTCYQPGLKRDRKVKDLATAVVAKPEAGILRSRLRPRGRFTASLQQVGRGLRGWWRDLSTSDARLAVAWLESHLGDSGAKMGADRPVKCQSVGDKEQPDVTIVECQFASEEQTRWLWVCPELIAHLHTLRLFRPVSESLLSSLRARARLWAKERGISTMDLSRFMVGSLVLSSLPMPDEVVALGALRGSAGQWSNDVLGAFAAGTLRATKRGTGWGDVFRKPVASLLGLRRLRGSTLGGPGCGPLAMPK